MPKYVEQNGNIFKLDDKGNAEYVPSKVEQDGNVFEFDSKIKDYKFVEKVESAPQGPLLNRALRVGVERGASLGARPAIAGAGSALGAFVGNMQTGKGLRESLSAGADAYSEGRNEARLEQAQLQKEYPKSTMVGNLGGSLLTAPLTPVRSVIGAIKLGGLTGLGEAIGEADTLKEAGQDILTGAALGGGTYGAVKGVGAAYGKTKEYVKALIPEKFLAKVGNAITGVPENDILKYAKETDEINDIIDKSKGNIPSMVQQAKEKISQEVQKAKKLLNGNITEALENSAPEKAIPANAILEKMEKVKTSFDPDFKVAESQQVDDLIALIRKKMDPEGNVNLKDMNAIREELQKHSKKAFLKDGAIFVQDKDVSRAAAAGYDETRSILKEVSPQEMQDAFSKLHKLHRIEEKAPKALLGQNKPKGAFLAAGSGENPQNAETLIELGKVTGTNPIETARQVSAARSFSSPNVLPGPQTGFIVGRVGLGAGLGAAGAEAVGEDPKVGALVGAGLTSPMALKTVINAGNISGKVVNKAVSLLNNPEMRSIFIQNLNKSGVDNEKIDALKRRLQHSR